jgi:FkbM family methyltransferase
LAGLPVRLRSDDAEAIDEVFGREPYALPSGAEPQLVLDVGANVGIYTVYALSRYPAARIVCFEPDPANVAALRDTIAHADLEHRVEIREAAAGAQDAMVRFDARGTAGAAVSKDGDIDVEKVDVLPLLARADAAKIDIEGGEWEILTDPRFADCAPAHLVLEYHRYLCPERSSDYLSPDPNPRRLVLSLLREAGYQTAEVEHHYWGHGTIRAQRGPSTAAPSG